MIVVILSLYQRSLFILKMNFLYGDVLYRVGCHHVTGELLSTNETKFDDAYISIIQDPRTYAGSLEDNVSVILREVANTLSVCRISLWLISQDGSEANCSALYLLKEKRFHHGLTVEKKTFPQYVETLFNSRFIDADDVSTDIRVQELAFYTTPLNIKSKLDATIRQLQHDGEIQGVLSAETVNVTRNWTTEEKMFMTSIADLLSQRLTAHQLDQSEASYKAIFESATEGIMVLRGTKFIDVNPAVCELFRCKKNDLVGITPIDLSSKYQPNGELSESGALHYLTTCLQESEPQIFEWRHRRFDGTEFDADVTLSAVQQSGDDITLALVRDITARKEAERLEAKNFQLEIARKEAEELAKSKMNFLANMSHEIRTPMNGIFGMVSLVLDTPLNEEQKDYIATIQSSTKSLLTILNDVLEYSKLSNSQIELECREFNPRHLVMDVLKTFDVLAAEKGLRLDSMIYPDIPSTLLGDDHRIRQVLINLVGNAVKFTEKGSVTIKSRYKEEESDSQQYICFIISDTGIGMDQLTIEKLFQPFTQADASITRNYGGTGLGLAICNDLAKAMGGEIFVDSTLGIGTTFIFQLSLQELEKDKQQLERTSLQETIPAIKELANGQTFPNIPILLVEDNLINQKVTSSIIEKLGYPVTQASNGEEAVNLCLQNDYKVILMDLSMPGMDGFEATEKIRASEKDGIRTKIIAVTGHAFLEHRQRCEQVGIDDFLVKPFNLFKLKKMLDQHAHA